MSRNVTSEMIWSKYVPGTTEQDDVDSWEADLTTDAPTGTYNVVFPYIGDVGLGHGAKVKDGKFDVESTLAAVEQARDDAGYYWGAFLEDLTWSKEANAFIADIGS